MSNFFKEPKIVKILDTEVSVKPLVVKHIAKAAKAAGPVMAIVGSGDFNPMDLAEQADSVVTLVALATGQSEEWVGELDIGELAELLAAVITVNVNFFTQQALPKMTSLMKEVSTIANQTESLSGNPV